MNPRARSIEIRRAGVLRLALDRVPPCEIAERMSVKAHTVSSDIAELRTRGHDIPPFAPVGGVKRGTARFTVPPEIMARLEFPARRRRIPPRELVLRILEVLTTEPHLIDNVLDDNVLDDLDAEGPG